MKKTALMVMLACVVTAASAQKKENDFKYRRSSLYTIMVPSDKLTGDAEQIVTATFDTMPIPNKYYKYDLLKNYRHMDLTKIEVTKEEIDAVKENSGNQKKGLGGLVKKGANFVKKQASSSETGKMNDDEKIAKMMKFFKDNHVANQIVARWFNKTDQPGKDGKYFNLDRVNNLGLFGANVEDIKKASALARSGEIEVMDAATVELVSRTFIMVTSYSYLSYDELAADIQAGAEVAGAIGFKGIGALANLGASAFGGITDGYFITAESYLFQLDWNKEVIQQFLKYFNNEVDIKDFDTNPNFTLMYVGKTKGMVHAGKVFAKNSDENAKKHISIATERATDKSIAKLQREYDIFKTLSVLNVKDDGTMYAYIGKKEGVKEGDKFKVIEIDDNDGSETNVGTITVAKGKVWDNRSGIGALGDDVDVDKEDADIDINATYTTFDGKAKEAWKIGGMCIRQAK